MSKNTADLNIPPTRGSRTAGGTTTSGRTAGHQGTRVQRQARTARQEREVRQRRLWYLGLFLVIAASVIALVGGALWQYVIQPAQPIATVNGQGIRNDVFNRYQKFENALLNNQSAQLNQEVAQLQADTKHAASNAALLQQVQQQEQTVQGNLANVPAYTLSQMEQALELQQAAVKSGFGATPTQINKQMATLNKQSGYKSLVSSTGVQDNDIRTYFVIPQVVQQNGLKHFQKAVPATEREAKARHILVKTKKQADLLAAAVRKNNGATFGALAKKYSIDNGQQPGSPPISKLPKSQQAAALQAQQQSSAYNGGWLRDPSQPFKANAPTWLTPQTQFVTPVLNAVLAMKPGEVRVVKSQYGYHVIQVTSTGTLKLTKAQRQSIEQQNAQQSYQTWFTSATDATKNKVSPSDPYAQLPAPTATGQ